MKMLLNSSYRFSFGAVNFQIDIDDSLSSELRSKDVPVTKDKVLHSHPFHELFIVFDEEMEIVFEDRTEKYQNTVVCLPPDINHYTLRSKDYRFLFSCSEKKSSKGSFESFIFNILASNSVCKIPITTSGLQKYLEELRDVFYNQENELDSDVIISLLKCILYRIYSSHTTSFSSGKHNYYAKESRYITILTLIQKCTSRENDITISTIADALHLSKKQTARLIHKYYGKPLSEIITEQKLSYAAYLLKNSSISISDVAFESNFHSYSYFCHQFKKKYGCLPLHYRKKR